MIGRKIVIVRYNIKLLWFKYMEVIMFGKISFN